jgi:cytochrome c-type biogenesis protein CcmF
MNQYLSTGKVIPRPSVKVTPTTDLYLNLTKPPEAGDESIKVRIVVEPLIVWLWFGGFVMLVGTALSAFPGRRRNPLDAVSSDTGGERAAGGPGPDLPLPEDLEEVRG